MAARFYPDGALCSVTLGSSAPSTGETAGSTPQTVFQDDADDLPPGAYDPVAKAKREGK